MSTVTRSGAGIRRLLAALGAGAALVGALVVLQLTDDPGRARPSNPEVRVRGIEVSRASLEGVIAGAAGWRVEVTVESAGGRATTVARPDGRYRLRNLTSGLAEVTWVAETTTSAGNGIDLGGQRTGRTQVNLLPGANTLDLAL
jgi:hypothetical protein